MILVVSGWRYWRDSQFIHQHLLRYQQLWGRSLHVRVREQVGADLHTRDWLMMPRAHPMSYIVYEADWANLGKGAGPAGNKQMLRGNNILDPRRNEHADVLLAFPEPGVRAKIPGSGTWGCIVEAQSLRISVDIPGYRGPGSDMEERR